MSGDFAQRLRYLMDARGLTHQQVGDVAGVTPRAVGGWLRGAMPRSAKLKRLAAFFDVSVSDLTAALASEHATEADRSTELWIFLTCALIVRAHLEAFKSSNEGREHRLYLRTFYEDLRSYAVRVGEGDVETMGVPLPAENSRAVLLADLELIGESLRRVLKSSSLSVVQYELRLTLRDLDRLLAPLRGDIGRYPETTEAGRSLLRGHLAHDSGSPGPYLVSARALEAAAPAGKSAPAGGLSHDLSHHSCADSEKGCAAGKRKEGGTL